MNLKKTLAVSVSAAKAAGALIRKNLNATKKVNARTAHDIKLELDVRCQKLIEKKLLAAFPDVAFIGEEGNTGSVDAEYRWVVDPIDGTVNFSYGIPFACVCIALQKKVRGAKGQGSGEDFATVVGVIYDPFQDELWTATATDKARLNGKPIRVSDRSKLADAICMMGYGKNEAMIEESLKTHAALTRKSRKVRNLGSAGLGMAYIACGRFDVYVERGVSLWDIAAGGLIVERAGGEFWRHPTGEGYEYRMIVTNGRLRRQVQALM